MGLVNPSLVKFVEKGWSVLDHKQSVFAPEILWVIKLCQLGKETGGGDEVRQVFELHTR